MATYDVTSHAALSAEAAALYAESADAFNGYALRAEKMLDLYGKSLSGDNLTLAKLAVALQVSHLLQIDSDVLLRQSEGRGSVSNSYRKGIAELHPVAAGMARDLGFNPGVGSFKAVRRLR